MSVQIAPQIEAMIQERVDAGRYPDADAVLLEALRLFDERERALQDLRAKLQVGLDQIERGETIEVTDEFWDRIDREVDAMIERGEEPDPDVCP